MVLGKVGYRGAARVGNVRGLVSSVVYWGMLRSSESATREIDVYTKKRKGQGENAKLVGPLNSWPAR